MSLLSALYTGVSGLQTFGDSLETIGNNISNVNTTGFKAGRADFSDLLSQSIDVASGRSQIGRGVQLDGITTNFSQGSFSNTDRLTDLAINGNGFFVVNSGAQSFYTRDGAFTINGTGELVNSQGMQVQGYQYDSAGNPLNTLGPLKLSQSSTQPRMTGDGTTPNTGVSLNMNLNASDAVVGPFDATKPAQTSNFSTTINAYDSLGGAHELNIYFDKTGANTWDWHALVDGGDVGGTPGTPVEGAGGALTFNTSGGLVSATTTASSFNFTGTPQTIGFKFGDPTAGGGSGFAGSTQFASADVVQAQSQDGFAAGSLDGVTIDQSGIISGNFTNGQSTPIGQIALANFANLQGLNKDGGGLYSETVDSGAPVVGKPNVGGFGTINSNSLELSNVDLATEFVNMISTQRGYEANSKIITVGDQLLSEIVQIVH